MLGRGSGGVSVIVVGNIKKEDDMHLYELTEMYQRILDAQEDDEYEQALADILDNIEEKAENVAKVIRTLEAEANGFSEEAKRLAQAGQARSNRADHLKAYLLNQMQAVGKEKVQGQVLTVAIQQSPPSCKILNEDIVPESFKERIESWKIDRRAIIERLQRGEIVAGVEVTQAQHIRIRP